MKKRIALSLILLVCIISSSYSKNQFETKYTTADILNARKTPSLDGEISFQLPYGSLINVSKTEEKTVYKGGESYWYYVKEIEAYVLGAFLSDTKPAGSIQYTYYKNDSDEGCPSDESTLILGSMKAKHTRAMGCHGDSTDETKEGIFSFHPGYIEIMWNDYISISSTIYGDKKTSKTLMKGYKERLYWNTQAVGWLTEKTIEAMKKSRCVPNNEYYYIDCSESCESLNNATGCKKLTDWTQFFGTGYPYYCKTKH